MYTNANLNPAQFDELWSNDSISSEYPEQTINFKKSVNAGDYNIFIAMFNVSTSSGRKIISIAPINWYGEVQWVGNIDNTTNLFYAKRNWIVSSGGNSFTINECPTKQGTTQQTNNKYLIPYRIYGIKGVM